MASATNPTEGDVAAILAALERTPNDPTTLPTAISNAAHSLTTHYTSTYQNSMTSPEHLGFPIIYGAILDAALASKAEDAPAQDKLIALLKAIRNLGVLKRTNSTNVVEVCETWGGRVWADLPQLGAEMRERWNASPPDTNAIRWANFNAFLARCTQSGVHDGTLFGVWALREALETSRTRTKRESDGNRKAESKALGHEEVPLEEVLPAAVEWLNYAREHLAQMSKQGSKLDRGENQPDPTWLGPMAREGGVQESGLSVGRWRFWARRLEEISQAKDDSGGREKMAKIAYQALARMKECSV